LALLPTALAIDSQNSGTLYAGTTAGELGATALSILSGVRKIVDGGRSWSDLSTVWQGYVVSSLTVDPTDSSVVYVQTTVVDCTESYVCSSAYWDPNSDAAKKGLGLFKSTDAGATRVRLDLPGEVQGLKGWMRFAIRWFDCTPKQERKHLFITPRAEERNRLLEHVAQDAEAARRESDFVIA